MSRIKLAKPEKVLFQTTMKVSVDHLNYGNHVGNHHFLVYAHEARLQWLASLEMTELSIENHTGLIMSDSAIVYKSQLFWGDEFTVHLGLDDLTDRSFDILYHLINKQNKTIAVIKTGMVFFDYQKQTITRASVQTLQRLQGLVP
jgi:acyl-CoA thioester hydrolase